MASRNTHHIGEYCKYGTVRTEVDRNANITIKFFDFKTVSPVQEQKTFSFVDKFKVQMYLEDNMSSYYADKVMDKIYV
jgi:hypothetical protein